MAEGRRASPRRRQAVHATVACGNASLGKVLLTGGAGFLGIRLASMIISQQCATDVLLFDVRKPDPARLPLGSRFIMGDLRQLSDCLAATRGVDTVFHIASYGMSGLEMLNVPMIDAVNIKGTEHMLEACRKNGVARLVYTSTYNAVFYGEPLCGVVDAPYAPSQMQADHYSRTKAQAERLVLAANRSLSAAPTMTLHTCALRAAGIYGDGEERHFPRIIRLIQRGMAAFTIGDPKSLVEWVYVDNLAHAHILAALRLGRPSSLVDGQAYFVSDQHPVNNFEFFRPLYESFGYSFPSLRIPLGLAPLLSRGEVYKCAVSHYFDFTRAQTHLGYYPLVPYEEAMQRTIAYYTARYPHRNHTQSGALFSMRVLLILFLIIVALVTALVLGQGTAASGMHVDAQHV